MCMEGWRPSEGCEGDAHMVDRPRLRDVIVFSTFSESDSALCAVVWKCEV